MLSKLEEGLFFILRKNIFLFLLRDKHNNQFGNE